MSQCYVGIDVAKAHLDVAVAEGGKPVRFPHTDAGLTALVAYVQPLAPTLVVLEATGRYETDVAAALGLASLPVAIVNPRQVRDFAKASGQLAKTDALDATVLAQFGAALRPTPRGLPDVAHQALAALVARRRQLVEMLTAERNRLGVATGRVKHDVQTHIHYLEQRLRELDDELKTVLKDSPLWRAQEQLLRSVPGIGPTTAAVFIAELPELGHLTRQRIAKLVGVAPLNHDSGRYVGPRHIWGGRATVRAMLYMATITAERWNPVIRAFVTRLRAAGKPKKLARIAAMRKLLTILNAMVRANRPWATPA